MGETNPAYLPSNIVPERIYHILYSVKIIIILRDPVERAFSQYKSLVNRRSLPEGEKYPDHISVPYSFEEVVSEELRLLEFCGLVPGGAPDFQFRSSLEDIKDGKQSFAQVLYEPCFVNCSVCFPKHSVSHDTWDTFLPVFGLISKSLYFPQLEYWLKFFPREQFLVVQTERMEKRPVEILETVGSFLDIGHYWHPDNFTRVNKITHNEYEVPLAPSTRSKLAKFFRPHNEKLFSLIGHRFDWTRS